MGRPMVPALKIIVEVASFRLRRLEMANMAGALAIMLALRVPGFEIGVRLTFAFLLNVLVYLNNDFYDIADDMASEDKDRGKTDFLRTHRSAAVTAQLSLVASLVAIGAWWGGGLLWAGLLGGGVCWAYSARLKRIPYADVLAMMAWGVAMPMVGLPVDRPEGWVLLGQLGLYSGVFESIQVLRDHDEDAALEVQTTAVKLGPARTKVLIKVMLALAGLYAAWFFHPALAILPAVAAVMPMRKDDPSLYWNDVRLMLGITFLVQCGLIYWQLLS